MEKSHCLIPVLWCICALLFTRFQAPIVHYKLIFFSADPDACLSPRLFQGHMLCFPLQRSIE